MLRAQLSSLGAFLASKLGCIRPQTANPDQDLLGDKEKIWHEPRSRVLIQYKHNCDAARKGSLEMDLIECISLAGRQRCLPNQVESGNPVSLLCFLNETRLRDALADATKNPMQTLMRDFPKHSAQWKLLSYLSEEPNARELCQQALLEREASRLPDAFATHCRQLKQSLLSYSPSGASVEELAQFRRMVGQPELWRSMLDELILATNVGQPTVRFFLGLFDHIVPGFTEGNKLTEAVDQLCAALYNTAGSEKVRLAASVGIGASFSNMVGEVPETLKVFLVDSLRYNYSEDHVSNYTLLKSLFNTNTNPDQELWITGTYLYLTSRAAVANSNVALPQLALHNMLSDMLTSLSRTLLCCAVPATFMQRFSGADFQPVLKQLSRLNRTLTELAELMAVQRCSTFSACEHLFAHVDAGVCDELWAYKQPNAPWNSATPAAKTPAGPFGSVSSGSGLLRRLKFSDYSMYFEWSGLEPLSCTAEEAVLKSPILQRLMDTSMAEGILSSRLTHAIDALSLVNYSTTEPALSGFAGDDIGADGWDFGDNEDIDAGKSVDL